VPTPAPKKPVASGGVLGKGAHSRTTARITGIAGCIKPTGTARVTGRGIKSVTFSLDGHKLRTVKGSSATIHVKAKTLKTGMHKLTAKVTFDRASGAKPRTLKLSFSHCTPAVATPQFTG
jgi:hypothetical protein